MMTFDFSYICLQYCGVDVCVLFGGVLFVQLQRSGRELRRSAWFAGCKVRAGELISVLVRRGALCCLFA